MLSLPVPSAVFLHENQRLRSKTHFQKPPWKKHDDNNPPLATSSDTDIAISPGSQDHERLQHGLRSHDIRRFNDTPPQALVTARRPDSGGVEGQVVSLLANHFHVQFEPSQRIFHYDLDIIPTPSKEVARLIKKKLVDDNSALLSGACPAFDSRKNLYSPVEFQNDKLEFFISLPIPTNKLDKETNDSEANHQKLKLFRINIKLVSKLDGRN
ncbi:hypothetical protein Nepgr_003596 [Nepenthes gracilis]|uniref:Protein argonaute N-terminal domain-containing protein n=1 Tax=Nepenthes gracilis TaxID=150966 RepID=A0AAD3RZX5_NEPGR|nr:hypothetical protein Nepgr_003596 [Nepenthes gracilis]